MHATAVARARVWNINSEPQLQLVELHYRSAADVAEREGYDHGIKNRHTTRAEYHSRTEYISWLRGWRAGQDLLAERRAVERIAAERKAES